MSNRYLAERTMFPVIRWLLARPQLADRVLSRMRWGNAFGAELSG